MSRLVCVMLVVGCLAQAGCGGRCFGATRGALTETTTSSEQVRQQLTGTAAEVRQQLSAPGTVVIPFELAATQPDPEPPRDWHARPTLRSGFLVVQPGLTDLGWFAHAQGTNRATSIEVQKDTLAVTFADGTNRIFSGITWSISDQTVPGTQGPCVIGGPVKLHIVQDDRKTVYRNKFSLAPASKMGVFAIPVVILCVPFDLLFLPLDLCGVAVGPKPPPDEGSEVPSQGRSSP